MTKKKKPGVLFLDMDGVTCTMRSHMAFGKPVAMKELDPVAIAFINRLCAIYNFKIVISSYWRVLNFIDGKTEDYLRQKGLTAEFHEAIYTPYLTSNKRGDEIRQWLSDNPDIDFWWIIDDEWDDLYPDQKKRLMKCSTEDGITTKGFLDTVDKLEAETGINYFDALHTPK